MPEKGSKNKDGILVCARYAFMPNKLEYCGPDDNYLIFDHCRNFHSDRGLAYNLQKFATLYPYLKLIAESNRIKDVFDWRVVEAYWIGNDLLKNVQAKSLYFNLLEEHALKKKASKKALEHLAVKMPAGALPHHSFHVFNIPKRTGHFDVSHSLETMDNCRISWGKVVAVKSEKNGNFEILEIEYRPLESRENMIKLGQAVRKKVKYRYRGSSFVREISVGDTVSVHWNWVCEKITEAQARQLEYYTIYHLRLANIF